MEHDIKHCIVNLAWGGWYAEGSKRLEKSLYYHGFNGEFIGFRDVLPPNAPKQFGSPYNLKAYVIEHAIEQGYQLILWLDCSVWAIKDPNIIFDVINKEGYYFWRSGFNCAQTCSDKCLQYFDVGRDTAETWNDCSTSMFGVNMQHPGAVKFVKRWIQAAKDGVFEGSRDHDGQSDDPRFLFHRQDQSAASIILNQQDMKLYEPGDYSYYYQADMPQSVVFTMRGM